MSEQVKTLSCNIITKFGPILGAFAAIYGVSSDAQRTAKASNTTDGYVQTHDVKAISYQVNYWYSQQVQIDGYPSQQLIVDGEGGRSEIILVDIDHPEIRVILDSGLSPLECDLACAENHLLRLNA